MSQINNAFYDDLADQWQVANDHPIALLRAENALRNPWIASYIAKDASVLDIGCGAGLLTNDLSSRGIAHVVGIDLSEGSLCQAKKNDTTQKVDYRKASADALPFADNTFDVACAMDLLEHVENPEKVITEASRVLKPGGQFFFHTFNRNLLSYIVVIKGVDWGVANAPKNMHVYPLFIKPKELDKMMKNHGLVGEDWRGIRPVIRQKAWWPFLKTRHVPEGFRFRFSQSLVTGYCGFARKKFA